MKRHLLYIINPISGAAAKRKKALLQLVEKKTKAAGLPFIIYPSAADGQYHHLRKLIEEKEITDVVIAGGDGTVNAVISSLRDLNIQFGILPCGSGNGLALSAGIPKNKETALRLILAGQSSWTDAFLINDHFACMLCGLGFDAQVAHNFAADPHRGLVTYIKKTVQHFFRAGAYPFTLYIDNQELSTDAFFISIANSNQFGNNVTIAPKASLSDGLLDIVVMGGQNKLNLLLQAVKQIGGYNLLQEISLLKEKRSVLYFQVPRLTIVNPGAAPLHIDGDPAQTAAEFDVRILPRAFRLISNI